MSGATSPSSAPQSPAIAANFTEFERERRKLKRALQRDVAIKARNRWLAKANNFRHVLAVAPPFFGRIWSIQ